MLFAEAVQIDPTLLLLGLLVIALALVAMAVFALWGARVLSRVVRPEPSRRTQLKAGFIGVVDLFLAVDAVQPVLGGGDIAVFSVSILAVHAAALVHGYRRRDAAPPGAELDDRSP